MNPICKPDAGFGDCLQCLVRIGKFESERFLAENIFAGGGGQLDCLGVKLVGSRNQHSVDIFARRASPRGSAIRMVDFEFGGRLGGLDRGRHRRRRPGGPPERDGGDCQHGACPSLLLRERQLLVLTHRSSIISYRFDTISSLRAQRRMPGLLVCSREREDCINNSSL